MARHEFETMQGDELSTLEMRNATWIVMQTFVDIEMEPPYEPVFTHRVEVKSIDDLTIASIQERE